MNPSIRDWPCRGVYILSLAWAGLNVAYPHIGAMQEPGYRDKHGRDILPRLFCFHRFCCWLIVADRVRWWPVGEELASTIIVSLNETILINSINFLNLTLWKWKNLKELWLPVRSDRWEGRCLASEVCDFGHISHVMMNYADSQKIYHLFLIIIL